jgi:BirA family biotin operon repressor/biotin-[acetyl-CoA-carboxylase] ligase
LPEEWSRLCEFLERRYLQLRSGKIAELKNDYLNCLYGKGELRRFLDSTGEMQGVIEGIDQLGKLLIDSPTGMKSYDLKEIRLIG